MGRHWTIGPEGRARMSAAAKLRGNNRVSSTPQAREKLRLHMLRRRSNGELICHGHSAETRQRIASKIRGMKRSAETRQKMSEASKKRIRPSPNPDFVFSTKESWAAAAKRVLGESCQRCGWKEAECDCHHVVPKSKGGKHTISNAVILCPNCHRVTHHNSLAIR